MRRLLQLVAVACLLTTATARAQFHFPGSGKGKQERPRAYEFEWMWQYGPPPEGGRENALIQDPHFQPMLERYFTAPQSFWGTTIERQQRSLANTILDHLSVPGTVIADDNRYLSATGCVLHFCSARGLLWTDLNVPQPFLAFAATDWHKEGRPAGDPDAEYTLWLFSNRLLTLDPTTAAAASPDVKPLPPKKSEAAAADAGPTHMPAALLHSLSRFAATPVPGGVGPQKITAVILVDPDGTPHELPVAAVLGKAAKAEDDQPVLAPRRQ